MLILGAKRLNILIQVISRVTFDLIVMFLIIPGILLLQVVFLVASFLDLLLPGEVDKAPNHDHEYQQQAMSVQPEFLKAGILGSRIPDMILEESGHFRTRLIFPDYFQENSY